jgi:hypothetical protein
MENRLRLLKGLKLQGIVLGMVLLMTLVLPLGLKYMRINNPRLQGVTRLEPVGRGVLALAPVVVAAITYWHYRTICRRQARFHARLADEGVTYLLLPRPDAPPTRADKVSLWQRLSHAFPKDEHISFELSGWESGQAFSLRASRDNVCHALITHLMTEYPGVEVKQVTIPQDDPLWTREDKVAVWRELMPTHRDQPLLMATPDPQVGLLGELVRLPEGVQAGVQVLARTDRSTRLRLLKQAARATSKKPESGQYALRPSSAAKREVSYVDDRSRHHFVEAQVVVWASAGYEALAWQTLNLLTDTLRAQYQPHNLLKPGKEGVGCRRGREMAAFAGQGWTTQELGTLAHLVGGDTSALAPQLHRARSRALPAAPQTYIPRGTRMAAFLYQAKVSAGGGVASADTDRLTVVVEDDTDLFRTTDAERLLVESEHVLPGAM